MALITFTSDFGYSDHYVSAVKAKILSQNPDLRIINISHDIDRFNLAHGSHVISQVFRDFPPGTVHLVAINSHNNLSEAHIALKLEDHFFVGSNNGIFGLISEKDPSEIVKLEGVNHKFSSFPAKDIFAGAVAHLASGKKLKNLGKPYTNFQKMIGRKVKATKSQISGNVIRVDHYGNLITNIEKEVFDLLSKGNKYSIIFGREQAHEINVGYGKIEDGDCFIIFNSGGLLEIGINKGNAAELLGLEYDSPVNITFHLE